jgi:pyruvate kinase
MLSGETTVGKYPVECVKVLDRIARRIERSGSAHFADKTALITPRQKAAHSGVVLANSFPDAHIVVFTRQGNMGGYASHIRPELAHIFAFTPSKVIAGHMTLLWGVHPIVLPFSESYESNEKNAEKYLLEQKLAEKGDHLVVMSDIIEGDEKFDSIQLRKL